MNESSCTFLICFQAVVHKVDKLIEDMSGGPRNSAWPPERPFTTTIKDVQIYSSRKALTPAYFEPETGVFCACHGCFLSSITLECDGQLRIQAPRMCQRHLAKAGTTYASQCRRSYKLTGVSQHVRSSAKSAGYKDPVEYFQKCLDAFSARIHPLLLNDFVCKSALSSGRSGRIGAFHYLQAFPKEPY